MYSFIMTSALLSLIVRHIYLMNVIETLWNCLHENEYIRGNFGFRNVIYL